MEYLEFRTVITIGYYIVAIVTVLFVIRDNRSPHKTLSWILVLLTLPLLGLLLYFYFGHNFKRERLFDKKRRLTLGSITRLLKEQSIELTQHPELLGDAIQHIKTIKLILNKNRGRLTSLNSVKILNNGNETYGAILKALETAKSFIHIEYYIFDEGIIANKIADILKRKSQEGVEVRFLYDAVGSWDLSENFIEDLRQSGIKCHQALPVRFPTFTSKINYRNHRKIVLVDGNYGFLGGINISDKYIQFDEDIGGNWRDTHLQLEGECLQDLQLIFLTDWYFVTEEYIEAEDRYFPEITNNNDVKVQILPSGPDTDHNGVMNAFFSAINSAQNSIRIVTPYFLPNDSILTAIKNASYSGISVTILIPGLSDSKIVQLGSQSYFDELLRAGVSIYQYHGGFIHSKILIIDDVMTSIGTANMDFRSLEQNMEVNAMIYDRAITQDAVQKFNSDLKSSIKLSQGIWRRRSRKTKILESAARLFAPLM